jgi:hypothetical protein
MRIARTRDEGASASSPQAGRCEAPGPTDRLEEHGSVGVNRVTKFDKPGLAAGDHGKKIRRH